jgi:hypothetical protein
LSTNAFDVPWLARTAFLIRAILSDSVNSIMFNVI